MFGCVLNCWTCCNQTGYGGASSGAGPWALGRNIGLLSSCRCSSYRCPHIKIGLLSWCRCSCYGCPHGNIGLLSQCRCSYYGCPPRKIGLLSRCRCSYYRCPHRKIGCYLDAEVCIIMIPVCVLHFGRRQVERAGLFCTHFATFCVKKRKGRGSRREQKALCQQLSREEQQRMKEIESGLFINEVRISVTNEDEDEEDDGSDVSIDWPRLAVYIGFSSMQKCVYEVCVWQDVWWCGGIRLSVLSVFDKCSCLFVDAVHVTVNWGWFHLSFLLSL